MADPLLGEDLIISVEDPNAPATYVEVTNFNAFSRTSNREVKSTKVFNATRPIRQPSRITEDSFAIGGLKTPDDAGQIILVDAAEAGTIVKLRILPDGVDGYTQDVLLSQMKDDADPDDWQKLAFDVMAVGAKQAYVGP